jgi:hypothetical protein
MKLSGCKIVGLFVACITILSCEKSNSGSETPKVLPTVTSASVSNLTNTTLTFGGDVTNVGDSPVISKGVCWGLSSNPKITDNKCEGGSGTGSFSCNVTGLTPRSTYHIRSFATNSSGTSYGYDVSFTTLDNDMLPVSVAPLLTKNWTVFTWPYNIYYPSYNGTNAVNGKLAAPCGPTTLSRVLAYWNGRITATGTIDANTTTNDCHFTIKLDTVAINYNNLPATLSASSSPAEYRDVAKLFLVAGAVSLTNFIDVGTPGDLIIDGFKKYFNVSSNVHFIKRWDYSKSQWIKLLKTELAAGRPLMIAARTLASPDPGQPGSVAGHWFNIEGYNEQDQFYINYNYSGAGFKGYFDVDSFGEYCKAGLVVAGFEPK